MSRRSVVFSAAQALGAGLLATAALVAPAQAASPDSHVISAEQLVDQLAGHAPPAHLAEQHDEERRGVGGSVVDAPTPEGQ